MFTFILMLERRLARSNVNYDGQSRDWPQTRALHLPNYTHQEEIEILDGGSIAMRAKTCTRPGSECHKRSIEVKIVNVHNKIKTQGCIFKSSVDVLRRILPMAFRRWAVT